jgi:hypothetical protein
MNGKVHRKIGIPPKRKEVIQELEKMLDDLITEIIAMEEQNLKMKKSKRSLDRRAISEIPGNDHKNLLKGTIKVNQMEEG